MSTEDVSAVTVPEQPSESEPQSELGPASALRPPASAFALGAVLIAMIGGSIAILFLFNRSSFALGLASVGIAVSLVGLIFLIYGNSKRTRLIIEFSTHAAELMTALRYADDYRYRQRAFARLRELQRALLILHANDEALKISRWVVRYARQPRPDLEDK